MVLVRWGKATEKSCNICGEAVGTAKHLLVGCRVLLDKGQYSRRHDVVLEIVREAVGLSVASAQRGITTTKRSIEFVKEGSFKKSKPKPYSILGAAPDWTLLMNTYENQYKIPEDVGVSLSRPDLFLYSKHLKRMIIVKLTVPWETNIPRDHTFKLNKYYKLTNELYRNKFIVNIYAVKVGARGITAKFLYNLFKDLGLTRTSINSFLERILNALFADAEFRIIAPQIICHKHENISNEEPDYSVITIKPTISTTGRITTITDLHFTWVVRWVPLPAPSQRFTLMLWNTIRALEKKLNQEQSTELVYFIKDEELLGGVNYIFNVTATKSAEKVGSTKSFSINFENGNQTLQDIEGHSDKFSVMLLGGQTVYADLEYILEAEVTVCSPTEDYYFSWSVFSTTSDHMINISNIAGSRLEIPAYSLRAGSAYEVNCEIKSNSSDHYIADVSLSFFVRKRGLQVFLNIDYLIVPTNYNFTIESIVIYKDLENFVPDFEWQCTRNGTACDFFENSTEKNYNFSNGLSEEGEYKISLTVSVLDEVVVANATIKTFRAILPLLQIQPISRIVNEGGEVYLVGEASNLAPSCSLTWYFASKECLETADSCYAFSHGEAVSEPIKLYSIEENFLYDLVDFTNETQTRTAKANITAKAGRVRLVAECNCSIAFECETQGISYGDIYLQLNESPKINNLTVSPQSGPALDAVFRLSASASDPNGPLRYSFYCAVANETLLLGSYLDHFAVETFLPYISGTTTVFVEVCDALGACTRSEPQLVNVTPSISDITKLIVKTQAHIRRCEVIALKHILISTVVSLTDNQQQEQLTIFTRSLLEMLPALRTRCVLSERDYSDVMSQLAAAGVDTAAIL